MQTPPSPLTLEALAWLERKRQQVWACQESLSRGFDFNENWLIADDLPEPLRSEVLRLDPPPEPATET